jgi:signal transduction histidine kinase
VSLAAHELRTPLAVIQGFASLLSVQTAQGQGRPLDDWQQEAMAEITRATVHLNALVDDLLDVTRLQGGRLVLHTRPLELIRLLRRCLTRLQLTTTEHTLMLEAPDAPVLLAADGLRLEQIFGNLVGNAIKFSPQGGPITVSVQADPAAGQVEVRVHDTGIGIPADERAQLFQRFTRARNVHEHHIPGAGLGLYVCRELVERHGGQLLFESEERQGTTFFLTLPLLPATDLARIGVGEEEALAEEEDKDESTPER